MDADGIRRLFAGIVSVRIRRMFGGQGIFDGPTMFALEFDGEIYLKSDSAMQQQLLEAGCAPFSYARQGRDVALSYWRLPEAALDDDEALRRWTSLALGAARKAAKPLRRPG